MFSFESFFGDLDAALAHIKQGTHILFSQSWMALFSSNASFGPLEYEVIRALAFMKGQLTLITSAEPLSMMLKEKSSLQSQVDGMPTTFHNLRTAEVFFFAVMGKAMQYQQACLKWARDSSQRRSKLADESGYEPLWGYDASLHKHDLPEVLRAEYSQHLSAMHKWELAFRGFLTKPISQKDKSSSILLIHEIGVRLRHISLASEDEGDFDQYLPDCKTVVSLVREYTNLEDQQHKTQRPFTAESNILMSLWAVVLTCRNRSLRREALKMLRVPRQEGVWRSEYLAKAAAWVVDIEEKGCIDQDDEFVPVAARVKVVRAKIMKSGLIDIACLRKHPKTGEYSQLLEDWIDLGMVTATPMMLSGLPFRERPTFETQKDV